MADDEISTEQIRQLTLADREKATDEGDVLSAVDMRLLDPAAGGDPDLETVVLDETDLMATDEFQQLARSAERLNSSVARSIIATSRLRQLLEPEESAAVPATAEQPPYDTTITEIPKRFVDSTTENTVRTDKSSRLMPTLELKQILQVEDEPEDRDPFDPYNRR